MKKIIYILLLSCILMIGSGKNTFVNNKEINISGRGCTEICSWMAPGTEFSRDAASRIAGRGRKIANNGVGGASKCNLERFGK